MKMGDKLSYAIGTRLYVHIRHVQFREGIVDEYHPDWVVASRNDGLMHLLYGTRHEVIPRAGMRAVMEYRTPGHWVLVEELLPISPDSRVRALAKQSG
jgi:hypothetical protein